MSACAAADRGCGTPAGYTSGRGRCEACRAAAIEAKRISGQRRRERAASLMAEHAERVEAKRAALRSASSMKREEVRNATRAAGLPAGDRRHGTVSGYTAWGCRCIPCKEAISAYAKARAAKGLPPGDMRHGTVLGYKSNGCRCGDCTAASSAAARERNRNNPDRVRTSRAKRAGLLESAWVEDIKFDVIIERAQGNCCLCGLPVDFDAAPRARAYPTLEHLTPLERGGKHSYENCDLAHWSCNSSKNTLTMDEFLAREAARPFRRTCFARMAEELGLARALGVCNAAKCG